MKYDLEKFNEQLLKITWLASNNSTKCLIKQVEILKNERYVHIYVYDLDDNINRTYELSLDNYKTLYDNNFWINHMLCFEILT